MIIFWICFLLAGLSGEKSPQEALAFTLGYLAFGFLYWLTWRKFAQSTELQEVQQV